MAPGDHPISDAHEGPSSIIHTQHLSPEELALPVNPLIAVTATHEKARSCGVYGTRSADYWSIQYQYTAYVCASPHLDVTQKEVWTRAMQFAFGKFVAAIKASLHPRVTLAVSHEVDRFHRDQTDEMLRKIQTLSTGAPDTGVDLSDNKPVSDIHVRAIKCQKKGCRMPHGLGAILVCNHPDCHSSTHAACVDAHFEASVRHWCCEIHKKCPKCHSTISSSASALTCELCDDVYHVKCVTQSHHLKEGSSFHCHSCLECETCGTKIPLGHMNDPSLWTGEHLRLAAGEAMADGDEESTPRPKRLCSYCASKKTDELIKGYGHGLHPSCKVCNITFGPQLPTLSMIRCPQCDLWAHYRCTVVTEDHPKGVCSNCHAIGSA